MLQNCSRKEQFVTAMLKKNECASQNHYNTLDKTMYNILLKEVIESKNSRSMSTRNIRRVKRFDILEENGVQKLIQKIKPGESLKYFLTIDDMFDEISNMDQFLEHNARDRLLYELKQFCANVTKDMIIEYMKNCDECQSIKMKKNKASNKSNIQNFVQKRAQLEVIEKCSDFLMIYEDCNTRFIILKFLKNDSLDEISNELLMIFSLFGAPNILQNKYENNLVERLNKSWPDLLLISLPLAENLHKQEIETLIANWLEENKQSNWVKSLPFVQYLKNIQYCDELKCSPFKAMFNHEPRINSGVYFCANNLSSELLNIKNEDISDNDDEEYNIHPEHLVVEPQTDVQIDDSKTDDFFSNNESKLLISCNCEKKCSNDQCPCTFAGRICGVQCHNNELCRNK